MVRLGLLFEKLPNLPEAQPLTRKLIWTRVGGTVYGATDELGYKAVENQVSVADWHATVLHQLGLHHEDLFFARNGLKERLTFTHKPRVVKEILA